MPAGRSSRELLEVAKSLHPTSVPVLSVALNWKILAGKVIFAALLLVCREPTRLLCGSHIHAD